MSKIADDAEAIRRRLEEIEAEKQLALTGSSAPQEEVKPIESVYGLYGDYVGSSAHPAWPYAGTAHEWRGFVTQK